MCSTLFYYACVQNNLLQAAVFFITLRMCLNKLMSHTGLIVNVKVYTSHLYIYVASIGLNFRDLHAILY